MPVNILHISVSKDLIADFCKRHHIRKLAFFGSVLRDDFGLDSDIDVLVEYEEGMTPGFAIIDQEQELSRLLGGRKVDLVTFKGLNRWIRTKVLSEAYEAYAA